MVARRHLLGCALVLSLVALCLTATNAVALKFGSCTQSSQFRCATLTVPLDHSGKSPGEMKLRVAAQRRFPRGAGLIVALAGGPGQAAVPFADSFAGTLAPLLKRYRLVVIDQRGTGSSGALSCPRLQRVGGRDLFDPTLVSDCAQLIGSRRRFYSTLDSVADLEAVRRAFGARKLALMGVSYGTWVAQQYARKYPTKTDSLILDSVVGPSQPRGFYLDTFGAIPRVTAEQCAAKRCVGITKDPVGDLTAVVERAATTPLRGSIYDYRGRRYDAAYRDQAEVAGVIRSGDLNVYLQAQLPASMAAARAGDYAQLLRLLPLLGGAPLATRELSLGLNFITSCLDLDLPYPLSSSATARPAAIATALAAIPQVQFAPFSAATVGLPSGANDCRLFPTQFDTAPATGPLPNVPALVLAGQLDLRTPAENGIATAALLPQASLVQLRGAGHDLLDGDTTGCVATALKRFAARTAVGAPCANRDNALKPSGLAPRKVSEARPVSGISGGDGRALAVALASVTDAVQAGYTRLAAGAEPRSGGLRGGSFDATSGPMSRLRLRGYRYAADLALDGEIRLFSSGPRGTLQISGAASGYLKLSSWNSVSGVINGRPYKWTGSRAQTTRRPSGRRAQLALFR